MIPWRELGRARAPDGGELILRERDGEFVIRVDGHELMSSRAHGSEDAMAHLACDACAGADAPRVLIGGLGLGYTLRATLDILPPNATVVVAEVVPAVVEWNRGPLGPLAGRPLDDPRTQVHVGDVMALVRQSTVRFDAVLLDVDNGPAALTRKANQVIYAHTGVETFKRVLRRGGALAVWSADRAPAFERLLRKVGFTVSSTDVPARGVAGGPMHTVIVGRVG